MNKKLKEIILYVLIGSFSVILPELYNNYFSERRENLSYKRIKEDHETCLQKAERDKVETRWCDEIKSASTLTYTESRNADKTNSGLILTLFPIISMALMFAVINLRRQIEELKEKIDA